MKGSYYQGIVCSNCGAILKHQYVNFCPKCKARIVFKKESTKVFLITFIVLFVVLYLIFLYIFNTLGGISEYVDTFEEFNFIMIICFASAFVLLGYTHRKNNLRAEEDASYIGSYKTAVAVRKIVWLKVETKYRVLTAIFLLSLAPVFFVFFFLDMEYDIADSIPIIIVFLSIWIFNLIAPFYFMWKGTSKALKKKMKEEQYDMQA